ncbi:MAG TPA: SDR family NAD(P)-dependent oxidoreductase [Xanthobacteraceae bacterium]|nr:SDR family NAD(P)-dependent oxidoreductase [Xanthobacteraceae bacterium]
MRLSGNTVLITGGTSGIGLELAGQLAALDNTVIVTGRNQSKLEAARKKLPGAYAIQSDASDPTAIAGLYEHVVGRFPDLNMLINNAGIMRKINLHDFSADLRDLTREIEINLDGPIRMTVQFLPQLKAQKTAAIVNVSSGLAFVPLAISPVYCAAKAAIHSFTQSLRLQLKDTNVVVFELAPPITETSLFDGEMSRSDVKVKPMKVTALVRQALDGIEHDRLEIRPGLANLLKLMGCVAPRFMVRQLGKPVDRMLARRQ